MATRRATRKSGRKGTRKAKASNWAMMVKKVHMELKKKNKTASLGDAMKEASRRRKRGGK